MASRGIAVGYAVALVLLAFLVHNAWFVCDDAFISFRYARNWANGDGLTYTPGEPPVEGFSNFVWVVVATLTRVLGLDETRVIPVVSSVLAGVLVLATGERVRRLISEKAAIAAAILVATSGAVATWASSGLETVPWALTLFLTWWAWERNVPPGIAAGLAILGAASRPEGMIWFGVIAALTALGPVGPNRCWRLSVAGSAAGIGALLLLRYATFGEWVTNTALAKGDAAAWYYVRGLQYVTLNMLELVLPLAFMPAAAYTLWRWRPTRPLDTRESAALMGLAHLVFAVATGGDYLPFGRFLVSAIPFFALVVVGSAEKVPGRGVWLAVAVVATIAPQVGRSLVPDALREALNFRRATHGIFDEREAWVAESQDGPNNERMGRALREVVAPDEPIVFTSMGRLAYYSHRPVIDRCFLVQPMPPGVVKATDRQPGHDSCVRRVRPADLADLRAVGGYQVQKVPEHARAGRTWSVLTEAGVLRTFYPVAELNVGGEEGDYLAIDRYLPEYVTAP